MVKVELKGVARVRAKGLIYYYAWRGGPPLRGEPGSPEFVASYNEAIDQHRAPDKFRFRGVVADYKNSPSYRELAESTRAQWGKWLDRIADHFGELRIMQFDRPEKIRPVIRRWREINGVTSLVPPTMRFRCSRASSPTQSTLWI